MQRILVATLLVSAAALGFEILLLRVLSIVQWHHFAYMIISLALLGYGASGTFIALARRWLAPRFETAFAAAAICCSVSIVGSYILGQAVPFNALEIAWEPRQFLNLALIYLVFFVPFFFAACCIGLAFTLRPSAASRVYFADLLGAGAGAILVVAALFFVPPRSALIALAALALLASVLAGAGAARRVVLAGVQLAWVLVFALALPPEWLAPGMSEYKGQSQALDVVGSRLVAERSSPLGYIAVVESPTVPFRHAPGLSLAAAHTPPAQLAVFTDGDGMTAITRYDGDPASVAYLRDVTAAVPFAFKAHADVLVLGAGGGADVLLALVHGARHVDAVELNPQVTALVEVDYADFAGHVYDDSRVEVHTAEARGYVAGTERRYDLIHVGLLDSFAAAGAGVQGLSESYLYTVEAIEEYLAHLEPGGVLSITRWLKMPARDSLKLVATVIAALEQRGVAEPGSRLAMIRSWNTATLLVKSGEFTAAETDAIAGFARSRSFDTVWYPGMPAADANRYNRLAEPYLFDGVQALVGDDAEGYLERYKFDITPPTDDRPYFFQFFRWKALPEVMGLRERGGAGLIEWGYLMLVATLVQALVAGLLLIVAPLAAVRGDWPRGAGIRHGSYFLLLGLAFLFVEMAFIQKFTLFLSHPLYAVAVVLAAFLAFAGIGSAASRPLAARLEPSGRSPIRVVAGAIAGLAVVYLLVLPPLFREYAGLGDAVKVTVSMLLIAPLAFLMGMPLPLGLARTARAAPRFIPWAWGINGFASVVSAVLATLLAIELGFAAVVVAALLMYGLAAAILR